MTCKAANSGPGDASLAFECAWQAIYRVPDAYRCRKAARETAVVRRVMSLADRPPLSMGPEKAGRRDLTLTKGLSASPERLRTVRLASISAERKGHAQAP